MKIDCHQHFWHYQAADFPWITGAMPVLQRDWLPQDCEPAWQQAGVTGVVAVQARCDSAETDFLLSLTHPQIRGVVGWVDLRLPAVEEALERWGSPRQGALKGLRHILQDEADVAAWVNTPAVNHNLSLAQRRGLVYEVLVLGWQLPQVVDFCCRHDQHCLVLDHLGKPAIRDWKAAEAPWRKALVQVAACEHVFCKLSGVVTEADWQAGGGQQEKGRLRQGDVAAINRAFDIALELFGPQRLLFGTDWPVCQLAASYSEVYGLVEGWVRSRLSVEEAADFWHRNAQRCYQLA